jgi:hypothetical protein
VLNGVGDNFLENISFTDVHLKFAGGGTTEEAAVREVPQVAVDQERANLSRESGDRARWIDSRACSPQ